MTPIWKSLYRMETKACMCTDTQYVKMKTVNVQANNEGYYQQNQMYQMADGYQVKFGVEVGFSGGTCRIIYRKFQAQGEGETTLQLPIFGARTNKSLKTSGSVFKSVG